MTITVAMPTIDEDWYCMVPDDKAQGPLCGAVVVLPQPKAPFSQTTTTGGPVPAGRPGTADGV
jgi:hypothetical protein